MVLHKPHLLHILCTKLSDDKDVVTLSGRWLQVFICVILWCVYVAVCFGRPSICTWWVCKWLAFYFSLSGCCSYLRGPEATGLIRHTFIHAGHCQNLEPPSDSYAMASIQTYIPRFRKKKVQYWLDFTEQTSEEVSAVTLSECGCCVAPQACQATGCCISGFQRVDEVSLALCLWPHLPFEQILNWQYSECLG